CFHALNRVSSERVDVEEEDAGSALTDRRRAGGLDVGPPRRRGRVLSAAQEEYGKAQKNLAHITPPGKGNRIPSLSLTAQIAIVTRFRGKAQRIHHAPVHLGEAPGRVLKRRGNYGENGHDQRSHGMPSCA